MSNNDFDSIRLSVASPEEIKKWSYGEVTKPETINYRTQKPERDGLFDERIFGPTKDYECYCGKYKKIRYKGVVCDKCGVEVTRSVVRRERMGHIKLAVPISHIWYVRGIPSKIGMILDVSVKDLERVIYFGSYVVLEVNEDVREKALGTLEKEYQKLKIQFKAGQKIELDAIDFKLSDEKKSAKDKTKIEDLDLIYMTAKNEMKNLHAKQIISEKTYLNLSLKYGQIAKVGIGAEAIYDLLKTIDIDKEIKSIEEKLAKKTDVESKKALRRLKIFDEFKKAGIKPDWMILTTLPVIPPDLRPMVQLDGGRFAASDLNDLYRRVINRNNRLKRLMDQKAPEVICRNEKRMLQEAVDALIDNSARRDKSVVTTAGRRKLKSLSDMLRGKQGRFRQNLLGKRVDYSGRSVIVVGPQLELNQVGLPKNMALELFKPFVISKLISLGFAHNVKNASRLIEKQTTEVWDILESIIKDHLVMLNRAPTLHRLGIQAFQPVLIEGKAIQIHPLVCAAYNADFDGDQMAVYIPLSKQAKFEASSIMASVHNLLKPASGEPIIAPKSDMVFGIYYLTKIEPEALGENKYFSSSNEASLAYENGIIGLRAKIKVDINNEILETSVGRIYFNQILPVDLQFYNDDVDKNVLKKLILESFAKYGDKQTVKLVDDIKKLGFHFATISGITFAIKDVEEPHQKKELIDEAQKTIAEINKQFNKGLITSFEKYLKTIDLWTEVKDEIKKAMLDNFSKENSLYMMITSGSRGTPDQMVQISGMKGLVANPAGEIIGIPILASYKEGLSEFEYFIASHGARKGKSDTALRTADAGYLTRRLIDVSQDVVIAEEDCGSNDSFHVTAEEAEESGETFEAKIVGRVSAEKIIDPKTKKTILEKNEIINKLIADEIVKSGITELNIRSVLTCHSDWGICQKCYGSDLATSQIVDLGNAVGIIAAQAIGEPGTQLTMRTFHIGGIAGEDITQGLPRVEELFEARNPKMAAVISEIDGQVSISHKKDFRVISIQSKDKKEEVYKISKGFKAVVKSGDKVKTKQVIAKCLNKPALKAIYDGIVKVEKDKIILTSKDYKNYEYQVSTQIPLKVSNGDLVTKGTSLTEGAWNLTQMLKVVGREKVAKYIIREIQDIYSSQGQMINDKHIELIVKQIFSKVRVRNGGDSNYMPNQITNRIETDKENIKLLAKNKKPILYEDIILGITKVALNTESFLSAASFQETTRTLINAATEGKVDPLKGLKENVIIGRLIPAGTGFAKSKAHAEMHKHMTE